MNRTKIKFCGITSATDAASACSAGADAIGMVFHAQSPRNVDPKLAAEILAAIPPFITPVGLFVDAPADKILKISAQLGLSTIQLHGHEPPELVAQLSPLNILKAIRVEPNRFESDLNNLRLAIQRLHLTNLKGLILETSSTQPGGTGIANNWAFIKQAQSNGWFNNLPPIIAAGGLTPESVANVVRDIHPFAVDVSSGIEISKGKKSVEKMRVFVEAVRSVDGE